MATTVPLNKIKVLLLENIHTEAETYFMEQGFDVTRLSHALREDELIEQASDVHLIGVRAKTQLTQRYLESARNLWGIGLDDIIVFCFNVICPKNSSAII